MAQALAWRSQRNFLVSGAGSVADVVRRLVAVPAWSGDPKLAVGRRLEDPSPNALEQAMDRGDVVKTYAFRGATHLFAAGDAAAYMAVRCANRQWELPSWRTHYGLAPDDWPALREVVGAALGSESIPQVELAERVARTPRFHHLRAALASSQTLLKPLAWQGDLCFGPDDQGMATFRAPSRDPRWTGLPDLHDAGRHAVLAYLDAYGPATRTNLHTWLNEGLSAGRRRLDGWIDDLANGVIADVLVDGAPMLHLREHVESLAATDPTPEQVAFLAGYDQWVLGPGTADERIVPSARRALITRGANIVIRRGRVAGTWKIDGGALVVSWFAESGPPPRQALEREAEQLSLLRSQALAVTVIVS